MKKKVVFNASTLILLAKVEILIPSSKDFVFIIPREVYREATRKNTIDAKAIQYLIKEDQIVVDKTNLSKTVIKIVRDFKIAEGEAAALALALKIKLPLATDDLLAIKAARILKVPFVTAIHFLLSLREKGVVHEKEALTYLEKLEHFGRYSERIITDARNRLTRR